MPRNLECHDWIDPLICQEYPLQLHSQHVDHRFMDVAQCHHRLQLHENHLNYDANYGIHLQLKCRVRVWVKLLIHKVFNVQLIWQKDPLCACAQWWEGQMLTFFRNLCDHDRSDLYFCRWVYSIYLELERSIWCHVYEEVQYFIYYLGRFLISLDNQIWILLLLLHRYSLVDKFFLLFWLLWISFLCFLRLSCLHGNAFSVLYHLILSSFLLQFILVFFFFFFFRNCSFRSL